MATLLLTSSWKTETKHVWSLLGSARKRSLRITCRSQVIKSSFTTPFYNICRLCIERSLYFIVVENFSTYKFQFLFSLLLYNVNRFQFLFIAVYIGQNYFVVLTALPLTAWSLFISSITLEVWTRGCTRTAREFAAETLFGKGVGKNLYITPIVLSLMGSESTTN